MLQVLTSATEALNDMLKGNGAGSGLSGGGGGSRSEVGAAQPAKLRPRLLLTYADVC